MVEGKKTIDLHTTVVQSNKVLTSTIDGEVVMMSIEQGTYSGLDAIGSEIWALLDTPRQVSEICDIMTTHYEVDREQCEQDVLAFLNDLASDDTIDTVSD